MRHDTQVYSKSIYAREAIESAILAYKHIATVELTETQTHYVCRFRKCVVSVQRVICEFSNYLIELMNTRGGAVDA